MIDQNIFNNSIDFNGAKGLVYIGEEILVYRRDKNTKSSPLMIDLPGGGKEKGESPFETFSREVKEEFGLIIEKSDIVYSKPHQSIIEPHKQSYFMVAKLPAKVKNEIIFGNEGVEYLLLSPVDYLKRDDVMARHKERISQYIDQFEN